MRPAHEPLSGSRLRQELRHGPENHFVDSAEFLRLLRSRRSLERADVWRARVRGLRDRSDGSLYLIETERLRPAIAVAAGSSPPPRPAL